MLAYPAKVYSKKKKKHTNKKHANNLSNLLVYCVLDYCAFTVEDFLLNIEKVVKPRFYYKRIL